MIARLIVPDRCRVCTKRRWFKRDGVCHKCRKGLYEHAFVGAADHSSTSDAERYAYMQRYKPEPRAASEPEPYRSADTTSSDLTSVLLDALIDVASASSSSSDSNSSSDWSSSDDSSGSGFGGGGASGDF